jgi:hypothetical protein
MTESEKHVDIVAEYSGNGWIDTVGTLASWLLKTIREHPTTKDCSLFTIDGDGMRPEHFLWCDEDGNECEIEKATAVSILCLEREPPAIESLQSTIAEQAARIAELEGELSEQRKDWVLLKHLAANAILMARNGEYSNGVTDSTGTIDEGNVRAGEAMANLEAVASVLGVEVKGTFYDNDVYYTAATAALSPNQPESP